MAATGIVISALCAAGLLVALIVLFPRVIEAGVAAADASPGRSCAIGAVNAGFLTAVIAVAGGIAERRDIEVLGTVAGLALIVAGILLAFGLAVTAALVGRRIRPGHGALGRGAWGAGLLALGCLTPAFGWFGLLPYAGVLGIGGVIIGRLGRGSSFASTRGGVLRPDGSSSQIAG